MTETTSCFHKTMLVGAAMLYFSSSASACPISFVINQNISGAMNNNLLSEVSSSQTRLIQSAQNAKALKIHSLRGKYSALLSSSEEFAKLKQEEIKREG
jgi:hypothetical protein